MGSADTHTTIWLISSLFWIGVLLVPLGLFLLFAPGRAERMGEIMNRWISTRAFFDVLNKPRYQERYFYRHHRTLGAVLTLLAAGSLYGLVFYAGMSDTAGYFQGLARSEFEHWLFTNLYYMLVVVLVLALVCGVIIFARPSALRKLEAWSNRWVMTDEKLESLDEMHELPGNVFSRRPRLFGFFILLGAAYIMYMTRGAIT